MSIYFEHSNRAEDGRASFLFVGNLNGHHQGNSFVLRPRTSMQLYPVVIS